MSALFVACRCGDTTNGAWGPIGRLEFDGGHYRFYYTRGAGKLVGFQPFPQMKALDQVYESEELFPLFKNRLFSESRPEYEAFLRWGGFDPSNPPNPIAILGVTEGIRQTDSVEVFPCPVPDMNGCYLSKFFLHGIRWMPQQTIERIGRVRPGESLYPMPDPCNPHDPQAVALRTEEERMMLGYVPRYLARDVGKLLSMCQPENVKVQVNQLNSDAPLQQRVLCQMNACWPEGFEPCSGEAFQPIPQNVSTRCEAVQ